MSTEAYLNPYSDGPVWEAFGLSYASYFVMRRRALQSMPIEWQERFVALVNEMHDALPSEAVNGDFTVNLRVDGKFASDPLAEYKYASPFPLCDDEPRYELTDAGRAALERGK